MEIVNTKPPVWDKVRTSFDIDEKRTIFTYGSRIHNPGGINVTADLIVHECVHERQQSSFNILGMFGPWRWWRRFIRDPQFRFEQELEAYRAQYAFQSKKSSNRGYLLKYLHAIASELAGPTYGNMPITVIETMRLIANQ